MNAIQGSFKRRWYDQHPETAQFVEAIQAFPEEVQSLICEAVVGLADLEFKAQELVKNYKSMGRERVLSFLQSQHKRRHYDKQPTLYRTMSYNAFLPQEDRVFLMEKANEVIYMTVEYYGLCKTYETEPSLEHVSLLSKETIEKGGDAARQYLSKVKTVFAYQAAQKQKASQNLGTRIEDDKIRG